MDQVWMTCPMCNEEWPMTVLGADALEEALNNPVEVCPNCALKEEEGWEQESYDEWAERTFIDEF